MRGAREGWRRVTEKCRREGGAGEGALRGRVNSHHLRCGLCDRRVGEEEAECARAALAAKVSVPGCLQSVSSEESQVGRGEVSIE